jgi:oxysterol-binding protein-related protein 3/6/7
VSVPTDENPSQQNAAIPTNPYDRVQSAIATLKTQHTALRGLITFAESNFPIAHESQLPASVVEETEGGYTPVRFGSPVARKTWMSTSTSLSDGGSIWFDAVDEGDGAEEFFLDSPLKPSPGDGQIADLPDLCGQDNSHDFEESDTDEEQEAARFSLAISERRVVARSRHVAHRTSLPSGPVADEGSLFAIFKKNVGKVEPTQYGFAVLC